MRCPFAGLVVRGTQERFLGRNRLKDFSPIAKVGLVLVQPELERRRSPLASIPPCGRDFQGIGVFRSDGVRKQRKKLSPALPIIVSMSPPGYALACLQPCSAASVSPGDGRCSSASPIAHPDQGRFGGYSRDFVL
jgi:hypothetical protein